jgi:hypothetical protein
MLELNYIHRVWWFTSCMISLPWQLFVYGLESFTSVMITSAGENSNNG